MHGDRRSLIGKLRRRAKKLRGNVPFGVSARFTVGSETSFRAAHAVATVMATPQHRVQICLRSGTYQMPVECSVGVDLVGEADTRIEWHGMRDTVDLNGADSRLENIAVAHYGAEFFYAIHADSPGRGGAVLESVFAYSDSKSALGVGLHPKQSLTARNCHFERGSKGLLSEPVLAHNSHLGQEGALTFENCTAYSANGGRLSVWTDMLTGVSGAVPGIVPAPARMDVPTGD